MTYQIKAFAKLSGVSERTLRYYHEIGLLVPKVAENGYRVYTSADASRLQQILFYANLEVPLAQITELLAVPADLQMRALAKQRNLLAAKQQHLQNLIAQVDATLKGYQEADKMSDEEKFTAFKRKLVAKNDAQYGQEVAKRWGKSAQQSGNAQMMGMSQADFQQSQAVETELKTALQQGLAAGIAPDSKEAAAIYQLHRQWLTLMWGHYDAQQHRGLMKVYQSDPRFAAYYQRLTGKKDAINLLTQAVLANAPKQA